MSDSQARLQWLQRTLAPCIFIGWAIATAILAPVTRMSAKANGFTNPELVIVDIVMVTYALISAAFVFLRFRRGRTSRLPAWLAIAPIVWELGARDLVGRVMMDLSGYPVDLLMLVWLGHLAWLALLVSAVLALIPVRPATTSLGLEGRDYLPITEIRSPPRTK